MEGRWRDVGQPLARQKGPSDEDGHRRETEGPPARDDGCPAETPRKGRSLAGDRRGRQRLQVKGEVGRRLEAVGRVLLDTVLHDQVHAGREVGQPGGVLLQRGAHRLDGGAAVEGPPASQHLVEDHSEREDVGAMVHRLAADLLGRHVAHGAHRRPGGIRGRRLRIHPEDAVGLDELGEAEVEDLDPPVPGHEQVFRLQVPVDDSLLVGRGEAVRDLRRIPEDLRGLEGPAGEAEAHGLSFEELRDEVGRPFVGPDVVDGEDVGMVEETRRPGLLLEALEALGVASAGAADDLDGDVSAEPHVASPVDFSHSARSDERCDFVGS